MRNGHDEYNKEMLQKSHNQVREGGIKMETILNTIDSYAAQKQRGFENTHTKSVHELTKQTI